MAKITFTFDDTNEARSVLDFLEGRSSTPAAAPAVEAVGGHEEPAPAAAPEAAQEFDANGMAWDADIHAGSKKLNSDGSWKARSGKAAEARAALDAFKAGGGAVHAQPAAPAAVAEAAPAAAPVAATGLPSALPTGMPAVAAERAEAAPVDLDTVVAAISGMIERNTLPMADASLPVGHAPEGTYQGLLDAHGIDRSNPEGVLGANESLRAAVYAACLAIDPAVAS